MLRLRWVVGGVQAVWLLLLSCNAPDVEAAAHGFDSKTTNANESFPPRRHNTNLASYESRGERRYLKGSNGSRKSMDKKNIFGKKESRDETTETENQIDWWTSDKKEQGQKEDEGKQKEGKMFQNSSGGGEPDGQNESNSVKEDKKQKNGGEGGGDDSEENIKDSSLNIVGSGGKQSNARKSEMKRDPKNETGMKKEDKRMGESGSGKEKQAKNNKENALGDEEEEKSDMDIGIKSGRKRGNDGSFDKKQLHQQKKDDKRHKQGEMKDEEYYEDTKEKAEMSFSAQHRRRLNARGRAKKTRINDEIKHIVSSSTWRLNMVTRRKKTARKLKSRSIRL